MWPSVDVLIPSYNEDPDLLEITLIAATKLDYPSDRLNVYLLDDGGTVEKGTIPITSRRARHESVFYLCRNFASL